MAPRRGIAPPSLACRQDARQSGLSRSSINTLWRGLVVSSNVTRPVYSAAILPKARGRNGTSHSSVVGQVEAAAVAAPDSRARMRQ